MEAIVPRKEKENAWDCYRQNDCCYFSCVLGFPPLSLDPSLSMYFGGGGGFIIVIIIIRVWAAYQANT